MEKNTSLFSRIEHLLTDNTQTLLLFILFFAVLTKSWRLYYPDEYVFDEVYVRFTAEEFAKDNIKAWVWDYPTPKGFAYDWSHPPMGRLIMMVFIKVLGLSSFSARVVPMIAGVLISFMVFHLAKTLFPKRPILWLTATFLSTLDGLILVMSRTGLADTTLALFLITMIYFLLNKKYFLSSIFFGMAAATKWTATYSLAYVGIVLLSYCSWKLDLLTIFRNLFISISRGILYLLSGVTIYILSYTPLISHYGFDKFIELQKQMFWYHTNLKATHPFQSPALSWPINYRPVWFYVKYEENTIENIYALGNPFVFWFGLAAVGFTLWYALNHKEKRFLHLLLAYAIFWMPWIFSPRIMFFYHYLPAVPFLTIILAFCLDTIRESYKRIAFIYPLVLGLVFITFAFFFPYWTAIPIDKEWVKVFQWLESWK
jgi:dolichyl-phosphate-mannose-protein mannosyltransferase